MPAEKRTIIAVIMGLSKTHETCPYTSLIPFMVGTWGLSPELSAPEPVKGEGISLPLVGRAGEGGQNKYHFELK